MNSSQKPISSYSLKFQNSLLESEYEISRKKSQEIICDWFSKISFGIISLLAAYRLIFKISRQSTPEIIRLSINASVLILKILLKKKAAKINFTPAMISAIFLANLICELESTKEITKKDGWSNEMTFVSAFLIATLQILTYFFKMHWFETCLLLIIIQVYALLRFSMNLMALTDEEITYEICLCLLIIFISAIATYAQEWSHRRIFYENSKGQQYLQFFHDLFKNSIPNPIIIAKSMRIDEDELIFANKASEKLLGTTNKVEMLEKLNHFSFSHLDNGRENNKRVDSENDPLGKDQLRFWNILRDKSFKERKEGIFKEYQAVIEITSTSHPISRIRMDFPNNFVDGNFKLKQEIATLKKRRSSNSENNYPLIAEHSEAESSSSEEDSFFALSQKKTRRKPSSARYFSVKIGKITWDDNANAILFLFQEVTDSFSEANHKAGLILAKNKNRLLASVSHQMRTPLNAIISSIDSVLPQIQHDEALNRQIKLCWRSAQLLYYSIGNIIDLSKISSKTFAAEISTIPGSPLIEEVLNLIKFKAKLKKITLESSFQQLSPYLLMCDPERLKQILINLLENSIKFTDPGGRITFTVTVETLKNLKKESLLNSEDIQCEEKPLKNDFSLENQNQYARFTLVDSGQGIEGYKLPKLFKLFNETDNKKPSEVSDGVGLGLALSQYLLKKMLPNYLLKEGLIKVQSNKGKGSSFSFLIPVEGLRKKRRSDSTYVSSFPFPFPASHSKRRSLKQVGSQQIIFQHKPDDKTLALRVLIVDDDQINQLVVKNYLLKLGVYNIEFADNGKDAVELVVRNASNGTPFELVLMDCNMPIMNGYEATRSIRELQHAGNIPPLKIIAITANVASNDWERCRQAGMNSYLTKPINKALFRETLERHLQIKFFDI